MMDAKIPPVDFFLFPSTFDAVHVGLAALCALSLLITLLLSVALLRAVSGKRAVTVATPPAGVLPESAPAVAPVRETAPVVIKETGPEAALQLLGLLQSEARFIDFIEEDIAGYGDADIGAAVRVVHEGCRKVLKGHFQLEPIRREAEGERVTLRKGFDASSVRLTGNIVGQAPFTGTVVHRGWRATSVSLPKVAEGHDLKIIAAAEVEL